MNFQKTLRIASYIVIVLIIKAVFFLSWVENTEVGNFQPSETLAGWINEYGNLRTSVPFFILSLLVEITFHSTTKTRLRCLLGTFLLILLAEAGQLLIPTRHPDLADIGFALLGSVIGMSLGALIKKITQPARN